MGGEIEVASEAGIGSTFTFTRELSTIADAPREALRCGLSGAIAPAAGGRSAGAILVVEDNEVNALIIRAMLRKHGYEPVRRLERRRRHRDDRRGYGRGWS